MTEFIFKEGNESNKVLRTCPDCYRSFYGENKNTYVRCDICSERIKKIADMFGYNPLSLYDEGNPFF